MISEAEKLLTSYSRFLNIPELALKEEVARYNRDFSAYDNDIYSTAGVRFAHWQNFLKHDWFAERLYMALGLMESADFVLDLGFSVPYAYSRSLLTDYPIPRFVFVDRYWSTAAFYALISRELGVFSALSRDSVIFADLDNRQDLEVVEQAAFHYNPRNILIVLSEVVEHLKMPGQLFYWLSQISTRVETEVYVTLPIGRKIPSHTLEFRSFEDARQFLDRFVTSIDDKYLRPVASPESPYLEGCLCRHGRLKRIDRAFD